MRVLKRVLMISWVDLSKRDLGFKAVRYPTVSQPHAFLEHTLATFLIKQLIWDMLDHEGKASVNRSSRRPPDIESRVRSSNPALLNCIVILQHTVSTQMSLEHLPQQSTTPNPFSASSGMLGATRAQGHGQAADNCSPTSPDRRLNISNFGVVKHCEARQCGSILIRASAAGPALSRSLEESFLSNVLTARSICSTINHEYERSTVCKRQHATYAMIRLDSAKCAESAFWICARETMTIIALPTRD